MSDTPQSSFPQQVEAARFRAAVSESLLQGMQANINYLLANINPIGTVVQSMLSEAEYQAFAGDGWVLMDGRDVSGSDYAVLKGVSTIPDARGRFLRGKNNGRSGGTGNPDGDATLGDSQDDALASHNHNMSFNLTIHRFTRATGTGSGSANTYEDTGSGTALTSSAASTGSNETRPRNITVNTFIRIN